MDLSPGTPCGIRFTKYDGSPHWEYDGTVLGRDEQGVWLFTPAGAPMTRPGRHIDCLADFVTCVPDDLWVLIVNAEAPGLVHRYVDITTEPVWEVRDGLPVAAMVDLDLDVVLRRDEVGPQNPFVDDEDEFAEHQVRYGYPVALVAAARRTCDRVLQEVREQRGAFGAVGEAWLARGVSSR